MSARWLARSDAGHGSVRDFGSAHSSRLVDRGRAVVRSLGAPPWRSGNRERNHDPDAGFTLVEILVAVLLLAFVVLSVMALLTAVMHQNELAQERSVATALASERVGRLMSQPFQGATVVSAYKLPEETLAAGPPVNLTTDYGAIPGFPDFRRVVTLDYDVPAPGMLRVEAVVYWRNVKQGEKSHEMVTYLHPGLGQGR